MHFCSRIAPATSGSGRAGELSRTNRATSTLRSSRRRICGCESRGWSSGASSREQAERGLLEQMRAVYREAMARSQRLQELSEGKTRHGNRRNVQERWQRKLRAQIDRAPIAVASADSSMMTWLRNSTGTDRRPAQGAR